MGWGTGTANHSNRRSLSSNPKRTKLKKRKKKEEEEKKKKKHKDKVRALTSSVKLKKWLLMEEMFQDWNNLSQADFYHRRTPTAGQNKIKKAHQKLFSRGLIGDFVDAFTCGDQLFEELYDWEPNINRRRKYIDK